MTDNNVETVTDMLEKNEPVKRKRQAKPKQAAAPIMPASEAAALASKIDAVDFLLSQINEDVKAAVAEGKRSCVLWEFEEYLDGNPNLPVVLRAAGYRVVKENKTPPFLVHSRCEPSAYRKLMNKLLGKPDPRARPTWYLYW